MSCWNRVDPNLELPHLSGVIKSPLLSRASGSVDFIADLSYTAYSMLLSGSSSLAPWIPYLTKSSLALVLPTDFTTDPMNPLPSLKVDTFLTLSYKSL